MIARAVAITKFCIWPGRELGYFNLPSPAIPRERIVSLLKK